MDLAQGERENQSNRTEWCIETTKDEVRLS